MKAKTLMTFGRECTKCKEWKEAKYFSPSGHGAGLRSQCKPCRVDIMRMKKFNLTEEELYELMEINNCEICNVIVSGKDKCIDHDHQTGDVRGILCSNCNYGLGQFRDSVEILNNAIKYLENE